MISSSIGFSPKSFPPSFNTKGSGIGVDPGAGDPSVRAAAGGIDPGVRAGGGGGGGGGGAGSDPP